MVGQMKRVCFKILPENIGDFVLSEYQNRIDNRIRQDIFLEGDLLKFISEITEGEPSKEFEAAIDRAVEEAGHSIKGGIDHRAGARIYAVIREKKPDVVVETGVAHGLSTLYVLIALEQNQHGKLYSVDYPFYSSMSLSEFRESTYDEYGGASMLPAGKDSGWIIPKKYRRRWELQQGKSQKELPKLVCKIDEIDIFIRDSEHSFPAMAFEFELAWEWLQQEGLILSDDIRVNNVFDKFVETRDADSGLISPSVGYIRK